MNLLLVNWQDRKNPRAGGAEVHVHEIFGRLAARGHTVTMLVSGWPGAPARERVDGMDVRRTGGRHGFLLAAPVALRRFRGQPIDLCVEALNKVPVFSPLWVRVPVVLLVHHLFGGTAFREVNPVIASAAWLLERPIPRVYRGLEVQAISHSTAEDLTRRGVREDRIRVIHPGVDTASLWPAPGGARFREPTILYLGRLQRYKGIEDIFEAVARLRSRGTDTRVVVAGSGPHQSALVRRVERLGISGVVRFEGRVSEARKGELLRGSWVHVLPSPKEGWGITVMEAAAAGTASVASDAPGLRESVRDGETGWLFPNGDVGALADLLAEVVMNPEEVRRRGEAARRYAETLTWERAAERTELHLEEMLVSHRVPTLVPS